MCKSIGFTHRKHSFYHLKPMLLCLKKRDFRIKTYPFGRLKNSVLIVTLWFLGVYEDAKYGRFFEPIAVCWSRWARIRCTLYKNKGYLHRQPLHVIQKHYEFYLANKIKSLYYIYLVFTLFSKGFLSFVIYLLIGFVCKVIGTETILQYLKIGYFIYLFIVMEWLVCVAAL